MPRRSVDGKHLLRFQSETSVLKFLRRSVDGKHLVRFLSCETSVLKFLRRILDEAWYINLFTKNRKKSLPIKPYSDCFHAFHWRNETAWLKRRQNESIAYALRSLKKVFMSSLHSINRSHCLIGSVLRRSESYRKSFNCGFSLRECTGFSAIRYRKNKYTILFHSIA